MASKKFKYFTVTTTSVVRAPSKAEAEAVSRRKRGVNGDLLSSQVTVDRIPATTARSLSAL